MLKQIALIFIPLIAINLTPVLFVESPPPVISELKVSPMSGPGGTVYHISVRVTAPEGIVPLLHQKREAKETVDTPIRDDGLQGDAEKGDGIYTGRNDVPATAAKQVHRFEVFVQDQRGRKSNVLEYRFTVVEGGRSL
jgi:hypothetical protein